MVGKSTGEESIPTYKRNGSSFVEEIWCGHKNVKTQYKI